MSTSGIMEGWNVVFKEDSYDLEGSLLIRQQNFAMDQNPNSLSEP